jgi:signal transduction histidine kinase
MSFSGRIRLYLILVAIVPPLLILTVIYLHSARQLEELNQQNIAGDLKKFDSFYASMQNEMQISINQMLASADFRYALVSLDSSRGHTVNLDPRPYGMDFMEVLDSSYTVLASYDRPGLIGEPIQESLPRSDSGDAGFVETVEYDRNGPHAALTYISPLDDGNILYTGRYLNTFYQQRLGELLGAAIQVYTDTDTLPLYQSMKPGSIYKTDNGYQSVLVGGPDSRYLILADFRSSDQRPIFLSLLGLTGLVAVLSALAAIVLGFIITGRAKREIDNLVVASSRIASGDFSTPVMAYEEGEFSHLADSLTDTMEKLKKLQQDLATAEKIAVWQSMGRKIAHEIKNPLTPIAVSADDLRRSYYEQLPNFGAILEETTTTIKTELRRVTKLLDQFSSFARMAPPEIREVPLDQFLESVNSLYNREASGRKFKILNTSHRKTVTIDPDTIKQVLINLVKNGFEAGDNPTVTVNVYDDKEFLDISVEDTGPGFSKEKLADPFQPYLTTKKGGSGLGLVVAYRIVHDHGGSIELKNRQQGGGVVRIRLPQ